MKASSVGALPEYVDAVPLRTATCKACTRFFPFPLTILLGGIAVSFVATVVAVLPLLWCATGGLRQHLSPGTWLLEVCSVLLARLLRTPPADLSCHNAPEAI